MFSLTVTLCGIQITALTTRSKLSVTSTRLVYVSVASFSTRHKLIESKAGGETATFQSTYPIEVKMVA